MNIKVIDFQILTRYYKNYQDGVSVIELEKQKILEKLEPIKKEMNAIISAASSGLIMDNNSQQKRAEDFQKLQQEAIEMDREFKIQLKKMSDDLNEKVYDELSEIINEWTVSNDVDLVTGKMEVIYCNDKYDATYLILEILKEKGLYVDYDENKKES
jgi:Skp family chaperone for outer membrane proteins